MFYTVYVDISLEKSDRPTQIQKSKGASMSRTLSDLARVIGNFRHYRSKGLYYRTAWYLAGLTLP